MSFAAKAPNLPQTAADDPKLASNYQAADPVPAGWGRQLWPSKWISDKFDEHTAPGGKNLPEWQYCSILAKYCQGPCDFVGKVFRDGKEIANWDYTFASGETEKTFTLNPSLASGRAWTATVRRGLPTQGRPTNVIAQTGQNHPCYRGFVTIEWDNIDLGQGSAALPSFSVEIGTHAPAVGAYGGGDAHPYGVNPIAILPTVLKGERWCQMDPSLIDDAHYGDMAVALEATGIASRTGDLVKIHPSINGSSSRSDFISQILAYFDGFLYVKDRKLCVGWFPNRVVDASTLPQISEQDLEEKPSEGGFKNWNKGPTSTAVVYTSFNKDYADDGAVYRAPSNMENGISGQPTRKDRPFVHADDQAAIMAAELAADPNSSDSGVDLTVFKSRAVDGAGALLVPGSQLNWIDDPHSFNLVMRVKARKLRMGEASDIITVIRERGAFPRPFVAPVDDRVLPASDEPGEISTGDVRF